VPEKKIWLRREKIQDIMIADKKREKREKKENRRTKETKKGSQNMIKVCIFDLDGTIADTVESIAHAVNRVLEHFGLVPRPVEAFNFYAGDGFDLAVERALKDAGDAELNYLQEGIRLGRAWFNEDPLYHVKPYPNMRETLTALREEVPIAVCSNKPHEAAIHVVESVYGPGFFNRIQGQTAEIPRKPSPIGALAIADALGARPEECLYFGDTNTDMQTGNAAGMFTVGVTWGFRPRQELIDNHAMELLDRPEEILTLFHRKNQEK